MNTVAPYGRSHNDEIGIRCWCGQRHRPTAESPFRISRGGASSYSRGGHGMNGDGTWPATDGRGCPVCGACGDGGHGGGCPNSDQRWEA